MAGGRGVLVQLLAGWQRREETLYGDEVLLRGEERVVSGAWLSKQRSEMKLQFFKAKQGRG